MTDHCYPLVREALRRAADVLEERPYMDPVQYLRGCAEELEDE